jgi:hypothetical protein
MHIRPLRPVLPNRAWTEIFRNAMSHVAGPCIVYRVTGGNMSQVEGKALMSALNKAAPTVQRRAPVDCSRHRRPPRGGIPRDRRSDRGEVGGPTGTAHQDVRDELLSQPELTEHAVGVLNAMPILNESSQRRARHMGGTPLSIVLRAERRPDVVRQASDATARDGRSSARATVLVTIGAADATIPIVCSMLWPASVSWC